MYTFNDFGLYPDRYKSTTWFPLSTDKPFTGDKPCETPSTVTIAPVGFVIISNVPLLSGVVATSGVSVDAGIAIVVVLLVDVRDAAITSVLLLSAGVESIGGVEAEATITKSKTTKNLTLPDIEILNFLSNWAADDGIVIRVAKRKSNPAVKEDEKETALENKKKTPKT